MECVHCGVTLRMGARFCNACGAPQPASEQQTAPASEADAPMAESSGRLRRPARVPRMQDDPEPGADATLAAPGAVGLPSHARVATVPIAADDRASVDAWAETETAEYSTLVAPAPDGSAASVSPTSTPPDAAEGIPADGLPWPLPQSIIIGGRYRVEEALRTAPVASDRENVYRVSDLQGYERCWSCGAVHGAESAATRFCPQCGADMLSQALVLRERLLAAKSSAPAVPADGAAHVAPSTAPAADGAVAADELISADDVPATADDVPATADGARTFTWGLRAYVVDPVPASEARFPRGMRVLAAGASDSGQAHAGEPNEDSLGMLLREEVCDSRTTPRVLAVLADGLGGHERGQEASRLVVRTLMARLLDSVGAPPASTGADQAPSDEEIQHALREAVLAANSALCDLNDERDSDMGATLVAALLLDATAYVANVGDSRAYELEDEALRRLTTDHSLTEQLIASGRLTADERYTHPERNKIYRSLGDDRALEVDIFTQRLRPGTRLLLCSDGMWEMVHDDESARILTAASNPRAACDALVRAANDHGGEDNISVIVLEISD